MSILDRFTDIRLLKQRLRITEEQLSLEKDHVALLERKLQSKMMEIDALHEQVEAKS